MSGRAAVAPELDPEWGPVAHVTFVRSLKEVGSGPEGEARWAAVSASLAAAGVEKSSEACKAYFGKVRKHVKRSKQEGGDDHKKRSAKKWTRVKREIRGELPDQHAWQKNRYQQLLLPRLLPGLDNMDRIHCKDLSVPEFIRRWEAPGLPVVIDGLAEDVIATWQPTQLLHRFANVKLKCGDDDDGKPVRVKLRHYRRYLQTEAKLDDSPLYVFDSAFGERAPQMLKDYVVPPYFREDLLGLVGKRRPPFRWIILGPRFSGSGIHIDPLGTSAWNMLMCGRKRWVLFTPDLPEDLVKLPRGHGREAAIWFDKQLPKLKEQGVPMIDFVQNPGETIFVPSGWWHVILNLDLTVAVTQNYASTANFKDVWAATAKSRPRLASHWLAAIEQEGLNELAGQAHALLRKWEPDRFAAMSERAPAAPTAKLVYVAADGSTGSADGKTAGLELAREQEARVKQRRDGLRDFMLDVRWRRRHRRDQRRREEEHRASCWCWPFSEEPAAAAVATPSGDMWICDDDHSTTSSDSSSSSEEEQEERGQQSKRDEVVAGELPYEPLPDAVGNVLI